MIFISHLIFMEIELKEGRSFSTDFPSDSNTVILTEKTVGSILSAFSLLAILLLCLGIFGLIGYSVTQRYKEISIRKIFGADTSKIIRLFTKEYAKLMLIATAIGIPLINYLLQEWMRSFPYKIDIRLFIFLLPVLILFIISMSIIYSQSLRATRINAAETLRNKYNMNLKFIF